MIYYLSINWSHRFSCRLLHVILENAFTEVLPFSLAVFVKKEYLRIFNNI